MGRRRIAFEVNEEDGERSRWPRIYALLLRACGKRSSGKANPAIRLWKLRANGGHCQPSICRRRSDAVRARWPVSAAPGPKVTTLARAPATPEHPHPLRWPSLAEHRLAAMRHCPQWLEFIAGGGVIVAATTTLTPRKQADPERGFSGPPISAACGSYMAILAAAVRRAAQAALKEGGDGPSSRSTAARLFSQKGRRWRSSYRIGLPGAAVATSPNRFFFFSSCFCFFVV